MEDIFRFFTLRPPEAVEVTRKNHVPTADPDSPLQTELMSARQSAHARSDMITIAARFVATENYVSTLKGLPVSLSDFYIALQREVPTDLAALNETIEGVFEQDPASLVASDAYKNVRRNLTDSLIATIITEQEVGKSYEELILGLRLCGLIERAATQDESLDATNAIGDALNQIVLLADEIFPLPPEVTEAGISRERQQEIERERAREQEKRDALAEELRVLQSALDELGTIQPEDYVQQVIRTERPPVEVEQPPLEEVRWVLSDAAKNRLSQGTKDVLSRLGISLNPTVHRAPAAVEKKMAEVGAKYYKAAASSKVVWAGKTAFKADEFLTEAVGITGTIGSFRAVGVADLDIVKQEILRYEAGEVAHIENVLQGEFKERTHRRAQRTEEEYLVEEETVEETERDLQTTDRFELQREAQETVKSDYNFDTELTIKYGGAVDVTSQTKFGFSNASEETKRSAQSYAQGVTERTVGRIQERVRKQRIRRIIHEMEETNLHRIDNTGANGDHVVGIYRWVDKIYKAQVYNYGRRMMFQFIVPEPGAFALLAPSMKAAEGKTLDAPHPPTNPNNPKELLKPSHIKIDNYQALLAQYSVTDASPPPEPQVVTACAFNSAKAEEDPTREGVKQKVQLLSGYQAKSAWITAFLAPKEKRGYWSAGVKAGEIHKDTYIAVIVGNQEVHGEELGFSRNVNLDDETGELPIAIQAVHRTHWIVTIEIICERTEHHMKEWQHGTYDKIMEAYLNLKAAYEQALISAPVEEAPMISGRGSTLNREIEKTELKRGALTLLTRKTSPHFKGAGSVKELDDKKKIEDEKKEYFGYPEIIFDEADREAPYIQFFEQAFEWGQMSYTFYPYFWARKRKWPVLQQIEDTDPIFAQFLQAGAARVLVPVRPGYEDSICYYLETNKIWNGSGPPSVSSPLYLSMVTETREKHGIYTTKGKGTISVTQGSTTVTGSGTDFSKDDVEREIVIKYARYQIAKVGSATELELTEAYRGNTDAGVPYSIGAKTVGEPWEVRIPTTLVFLQKEQRKLPDLAKEQESH